MKVRIITQEKYLFERFDLLNHFPQIKLDKNKTNKISLNRFVKSLNRKGNNIKVLESNTHYIINKTNTKLNLMLYLNKN